jgi:lysophospholipase L1-like esterase
MRNLRTVCALAAVAACAAFIQGCATEDAPLSASGLNSGSANFSKYVAMGNSLTAGVQSSGLVDYNQLNSYPALIAKQLGKTVAAAGGSVGDFHQPLVGAPGAPPLLKLTSLSPLTIVSSGTASGPPTNLNLARPYDNLGIPGAFVWDMKNATSSQNSWSRNNFASANTAFDLILRNPNLGNTSAFQQAVLLNPTFLTLWIGNNDALGAATQGITQILTPTAVFNATYSDLLSSLKTALPNAKLVVANVPDVTSIPFVTTLPPVVLNPLTAQPVLVNGNPVPLLGDDGDAVTKVLPPNTYVLLSARLLMAQGIGIPAALGGTGTPLPTTVTLSAAEAAAIQSRVAEYNTSIRTVAAANNIPVVDANTILKNIQSDGVVVGGVELNARYVTGGIFSLDGVHPTTIGYGVVANEFIKAINGAYGSNIPLVNLEELFDAAGSGVTAKAGSEITVNPFDVPAEVFDNVVKMMAGSYEF